MEPRSGLRMLKRTWSGGPEPDQVVDLTHSPPSLTDTTNHPPAEQKRRRFDNSWAPFLKTNSGASLNDLLGPPSRRGSASLDSKATQHTSHDTPATGTSAVPTDTEETANERPRRKLSRVFLSPEQHAVLESVVRQGKNVFFTGSAGTGKSVLLQYIMNDLKAKYRSKPDAVAVTASTGIAACNVGGITLHSFGGVGLAREQPERLMSLVRRNRKAMTRWMRTQVLVIDESASLLTVSMIEPGLFDKFEVLARMIRRSTKPFGGIQIVATGDFFQLPPVTHGGEAKFVCVAADRFESPVWGQVIEQKFNLSQVFRQKDTRFVSMLNEMRYGRLSQESIDTFKGLERMPELPPSITPTELFPLRRDVERANQTHLDAIKDEVRVYTSYDTGTLLGDQRERLLENFMVPRHVHLKRGAQVMLVKNIEDTLVNGSIGTVVDFVDESTYEDAHGDEGSGGAGTGGTSGAAVGGGRAKSSSLWPLVRFFLPNGMTREQLVRPETWKNEDVNGDPLAQRTQVPLILAWASTYTC